MPDAIYMANYRKLKYAERKVQIIDHLGGCCRSCGSTESLEVDHVDPAKKSFEVMAKCWCMSWKKLLAELKKCQLLCEACHLKKTSVAVGTHGTLSARRWCRCDLCKAAYNAYMKDWRTRRKQDHTLG
jgi:5-methylcytosine-specific restriction endonuclease McrA